MKMPSKKHSLCLTKVLGLRQPHPEKQSPSLVKVLLCIGGVHGSHVLKIMIIASNRQYVSGFEIRGNFAQNAIFFVTFQLASIPSPGFSNWFVSRSALLLHRSNARSYSMPPVSNSKAPK